MEENGSLLFKPCGVWSFVLVPKLLYLINREEEHELGRDRNHEREREERESVHACEPFLTHGVFPVPGSEPVQDLTWSLDLGNNKFLSFD